MGQIKSEKKKFLQKMTVLKYFVYQIGYQIVDYQKKFRFKNAKYHPISLIASQAFVQLVLINLFFIGFT
jgi:hypothetical protein